MYHELHSSFFYNHQSTDIIVEVGGSCNGENCSRFILIVHLILSWILLLKKELEKLYLYCDAWGYCNITCKHCRKQSITPCKISAHFLKEVMLHLIYFWTLPGMEESKQILFWTSPMQADINTLKVWREVSGCQRQSLQLNRQCYLIPGHMLLCQKYNWIIERNHILFWFFRKFLRFDSNLSSKRESRDLWLATPLYDIVNAPCRRWAPT